VEELASFAIDYTFWLNLLALAIAAGLVAMAWRRDPEPSAGAQ
jgi:hypothetical protein